MNWRVIAFETGRKEKPVEEFIKLQEPPTQAKITHLIDLLEKYGSRLGMPHSKILTPNLYELRIRGKQEIRVLYAFKGRDIYLLHAFKKQTNKTPTREISTAIGRLQSLT